MDEFIKRWGFVRSETLAILQALSDEQLSFRPDGDKWQPLYYQFGCIARTQIVYSRAAASGAMDFSLFGSEELPKKDKSKSVQDIRNLLNTSNQEWLESLHNNQGGVHWPDGNKSLQLHIAALSEHERIHHGQLISYFTLANIELPQSFKQNWAL